MRSGVALGVIAGLSLAILVLGARILHGFGPLTLLTDPAAWAMGFAGLLGLLVSATALQRASVVTATAATVATEAVAAAVLGLVVCGDRPMPGDRGVCGRRVRARPGRRARAGPVRGAGGGGGRAA